MEFNHLHISAVPILSDNYVWFIKHPHSAGVLLVDPGEVAPILAHLNSNQWILKGILITHHHWDHTGGLADLLLEYEVPVFASQASQVAGVTHYLADGQQVVLHDLDIVLQGITIPGHTLDHMAFYINQALFCGDTLFSAGCGRVFEGTMAQMYASLQKIRSLPSETKIYCGHEYTLNNLRFAKLVEPENMNIDAFRQVVQQRLQQDHISLPSTLMQELLVNPFLRCHEPALIHGVEQHVGHELNDELAVFAILRQWKDGFK